MSPPQGQDRLAYVSLTAKRWRQRAERSVEFSFGRLIVEKGNGAAMLWRDSLEGAYLVRTNAAGTRSRPAFSPPAPAGEVERAEQRLGASLSQALKSLLQEHDGVMDQLSVDDGPFFDHLWIVWPLGEIVRENLQFGKRVLATGPTRAERDLLFFAGAGVDGILFGQEASNEPQEDSPVFSWYPDGTAGRRLADTLADFLNGWLRHRITV